MLGNTRKEGGQSLAGESGWLGRHGAREVRVVITEVAEPPGIRCGAGGVPPDPELRGLACRSSVSGAFEINI